MKKKLLKLATLLLITPAFASCSLIDAILGEDTQSSDISSITSTGTSTGGTSTGTNTNTDTSSSGEGYSKRDSLEYKATDFDPAFSPSSGNVKLLIIPIQFKTSGNNYTFTYSSTNTSTINTKYFGSAKDSLKNYYSQASFNKLNVSGTIAKVYETTLSASTVNSYEDDDFNSFLKTAYTWTLNNNPSIDFSEFDSNNDGFADSVHFITNLSESAFNGKNLDSKGYLWPHMWYVQDSHESPGTKQKPALDVYLCTTYGMIGDTTSIHEQGHVFGVDDYYNYSENSSADYIGGADMQDLNCMDWNSYSKMLMNWVQPYAVDGSKDSVTITINPAATSGDCILIPSSSGWNGSAYDEYILLELFTNSGNNALFWNDWTSTADSYGLQGATSLGNGGVRMYHVDSRLYGFNKYSISSNNKYYNVTDGGYISDPRNTSYNNVCLPQTNSENNYEYTSYYVSGSKNFKLLSLIQAGKVNTFKTGTSRNALAKSDLFQTGSVFKMSSYSSFFTNGKFNNGSSFPYTITFDSVTSTSATITISK